MLGALCSELYLQQITMMTRDFVEKKIGQTKYQKT